MVRYVVVSGREGSQNPAEAFGHKVEGGWRGNHNQRGRETYYKGSGKSILYWRGIGLNSPKMPGVKLDNCCYVKVRKLDATVRL